jgi:hypothetical protein
METLGERLQRALRQRGLRVKPFAEEMRDLGAPQSSYPMVRRYLDPSGDYTPRQDWLVKAARLLRVRLAWLVAGDGPMELGEAGVESRPIWEVAKCETATEKDVFVRHFDEGFREYGGMTETIQLVFNNMFARWMGSMDLDALTVEERADKAVQLGELLMAPLRVFQPGELHTRRHTDFMLGQLSALGLAMPDWPE